MTELARLAYGVEVVRLIDVTGAGDISLELSKDAAASFAGGGGCAPPAPRMVLIASGPMGTYPVFAMNTRLYLRAPITHRWMLARKVFEDANALPSHEYMRDKVVEFIKPAISFAFIPGRTDSVPISRGSAGNLPYLFATDLSLMSKFACARKWSMAIKLIDMKNQCYGVIIRKSPSTPLDLSALDDSLGQEGFVYIPIKSSPHVSDSVPALYGSRPRFVLSREHLAEAIRSINEFIRTRSEPYMPVTPTHDLVDASGNVIGFHAEGLMYYHAPEKHASWAPTAEQHDASKEREVPKEFPKILFPMIHWISTRRYLLHQKHPTKFLWMTPSAPSLGSHRTLIDCTNCSWRSSRLVCKRNVTRLYDRSCVPLSRKRSGPFRNRSEYLELQLFPFLRNSHSIYPLCGIF